MANSSFYRIYEDQGNGYAVPTDFAKCCNTGMISPCSAPADRKPVSIKQIKKQNNGYHAVVKPSTMQTNTNPAVLPHEDQKGLLGVDRRETLDSTAPENYRQVYVTLNNTGGAAARVPIGDFLGIIADNQGIPAVPGTVTVGGSFGANTLAQLKAMSGVSPLSLKGTKYVASSVLFYSTGKVQSALAEVDGTVTVQDLQATSWPQASDFNATIQDRTKERFMFMPFSAYIITVPAGLTITLNFTIASFAAVYNMKKTN